MCLDSGLLLCVTIVLFDLFVLVDIGKCIFVIAYINHVVFPFCIET